MPSRRVRAKPKPAGIEFEKINEKNREQNMPALQSTVQLKVVIKCSGAHSVLAVWLCA